MNVMERLAQLTGLRDRGAPQRLHSHVPSSHGIHLDSTILSWW